MVMGTSLSVQPLGLHAFSAGHAGSASGLGTKILHAAWHGQKKKKVIETEPESFFIEREPREVK